MTTTATAQPMLVPAPSLLAVQMKKAGMNCMSQLIIALIIIIGGGISLAPNSAKYMYNVAVFGSCFWIGGSVSFILYR